MLTETGMWLISSARLKPVVVRPEMFSTVASR